MVQVQWFWYPCNWFGRFTMVGLAEATVVDGADLPIQSSLAFDVGGGISGCVILSFGGSCVVALGGADGDQSGNLIGGVGAIG